MSASSDVERKQVANRLRYYASKWERFGTVDTAHTLQALYAAFGVEHMETCKAFDVIADFVDPEVRKESDAFWTLEDFC